MLPGVQPGTICTPVVVILTVGLCASMCMHVCVSVHKVQMFLLCFFYPLPHPSLSVTAHVDPGCRVSQVTMAPACDTVGYV